MRWGIAACHPHGDEGSERAILGYEDRMTGGVLDRRDDSPSAIAQTHERAS